MFIDQVPDSVTEIKRAYKEQDYQAVRKVAHRIKPTIDIMGIVSLKKEIRGIEKNAERYQSSEKLENLISHLDQVIEAVADQLKELV